LNNARIATDIFFVLYKRRGRADT